LFTDAVLFWQSQNSQSELTASLGYYSLGLRPTRRSSIM
jgi:hypothetical protein